MCFVDPADIAGPSLVEDADTAAHRSVVAPCPVLTNAASPSGSYTRSYATSSWAQTVRGTQGQRRGRRRRPAPPRSSTVDHASDVFSHLDRSEQVTAAGLRVEIQVTVKAQYDAGPAIQSREEPAKQRHTQNELRPSQGSSPQLPHGVQCTVNGRQCTVYSVQCTDIESDPATSTLSSQHSRLQKSHLSVKCYVSRPKPASIFEDNQSTIQLMKTNENPKHSTKHINIRYYFISARAR